MNDVVLNWKKVSNYLGENTKLFKDRAYTTEEIQQLLVKADETNEGCSPAVGINRYANWCNS